MIFSKTLAVATLASLVTFAQADGLEISNPTEGTTWKVGETVFLQWKGNCASMDGPAAKNVEVNLMLGPASALRFVAKLATIDCSGSNTRKEFTIPTDIVHESGDYALQVLTKAAPSYSNFFTIETAMGRTETGSKTGNDGVVGGTINDGINGASVSKTEAMAHNAAGPSAFKSATISAVVLAGVFIVARVL